MLLCLAKTKCHHNETNTLSVSRTCTLFSNNSYEVMLKCFREQSEKRPPFAELVKSFTALLEEVAEYMDFSFVSGVELKNTGYDQLERYDHLETVDNDN